ncbi:MAG TPA: hypothetical protein VE842_09830, partial [Pyrinomonadaceae bacterium]|nr:hypothetical protein [Pyrinomonadaceae bacterium]
LIFASLACLRALRPAYGLSLTVTLLAALLLLLCFLARLGLRNGLLPRNINGKILGGAARPDRRSES